MDISNIVLLVLIIICAGLFFNRTKTKTVNKTSDVKKAEIVAQYKEDLKILIENYANDTEKLKEEKIKFIKNINQQLNKNIFFNEDEIKKIIYELTIL